MIRRIERAEGTKFVVYGYANGKKPYVGTFDSKRAALEAEEEARVTQRKIAAGELAPETDLKRTLAAAAEEWLAVLKVQKSRSLSIYRRRMDHDILPILGTLAIARITSGNITRWRDGLSKRVSAATVNTTLGTLSAAFEWFKSCEWIDENPCVGVKRLDEVRHEFEWLRNTDQITRLLASCNDSIRPIVALMVGTGLRLDEALHLEWDDIDLEHRLMHVHRGRQGTTKSGKARPVPLFDSVMPLVRELRLRRGQNRLVFPNPQGRARSKPGVFKPYKAAVVRAGLPEKLRLHDLRHSFAILYLLDGGDLHRLSRMLGHSSVVTTERCYLAFKPTGFDLDYGRVRFALPSAEPVMHLRSA